MSTTPATEETPQVPWVYLGGFLLFFVGLFCSFIGGWEFSGGHRGIPPQSKFISLAIIGLGIALVLGGSFIMARAEQMRKCHFAAGLTVCLIMTPVPSLIGLGINFLGNYLRTSAYTTAQVILVGVGVFLVTMAANWGWDIHESGKQDFRAMLWPVLADLAGICFLLTVLPMLYPEQTKAPDV